MMATLRMSLTYPMKGVCEGRAPNRRSRISGGNTITGADFACRKLADIPLRKPGSRPPVKSNFFEVPSGMASARPVTGILPNIHAALRTLVASLVMTLVTIVRTPSFLASQISN